jgi:hypothetical protein
MRAGLLTLALLGCSGGGGVAGRLEGVWVATDAAEGVHRGLEIMDLDAPVDGIRQGYTFYLYDVGDAPEAVQSGLFSVVDDEVLYDVRWDVQPLNIGIRFASALERGRDEILLDGRRYLAMDALPPGEPTPTAFGGVIWAAPAPQGMGIGLAERPDGGAVVGVVALGAQSVLTVGGGGEPGIQATLVNPNALVGVGEDIGVGSSVMSGRYRFETTPGDAFTPDQTVTVPVWEQARGCSELVAAGEVWVGVCLVDGQTALTGLDPADGSVLWDRPLTAAVGRNVLALGEDVLVHRQGPSPTPALHGDRGTTGYLLERVQADGSVRWTSWSPGAVRIADATSLADGTTVLLVTAGDELPGGPTWSDGRAVLVAIDPSGRVAWEREAPQQDAYGGALLGTDAGFVMGLGAVDLDFGGDVGLVTGPGGRGQTLALASYDACGGLREVATFDDCTETCWGAVTGSPAAQVQDLLRAQNGDLLLHAFLFGRFDFDGDEIGSSDGGVGVVARLVDPPVAPACSPDAPIQPVVQVVVTGPGSVDVPGFGSCSTTCSVPVERFAALEVLAVPGPAAQVRAVSGVCSELPCVLHADSAITSLNVEFELPDAVLFPSSGHVWAVGAGPTHGFVAGVVTPSETATLDGVSVADGAQGHGAWVAVMDASGVLGHASIDAR